MGSDLQVTEYREGRYISSDCSPTRKKNFIQSFDGE
jgi:hypothetical protein